jgi:signal transduction histidine kinase
MARDHPTPGDQSSASSSVSRDWGKRIGPRAAMISGFCAILVLMALLAFDSIHALRDLEASSARVRQNYLTRERTLREIRFSLYESGNLLREYSLTDSSSQTRESYLAQLHNIRERTNTTMERTLRLMAPEEQDPFRKLATELESYWLAVERSVSDGSHRKDKALLHRAALAQRAAVLGITGEISGVNDRELRQAELDISNVFARSRGRVQNFAASAFGIGLLLAVSSIVYLSRLENRAEEKYLESVAYQRELKELSERLVDAQEEERRAISRELHDQIAQTLAALLINVRELIDNPQTFNTSGNGLQKIRLLAEDCLNEVRNTALLLRPSMLDDLGLLAALEWQAREVSKRTGLVVEVIGHDFHDDLPEEYKTCIYRVVQEALNNCAAHAKAGRIRLLLKEDAAHCVLSIDDDGVGFDPNRTRGMGLLGMHERVARLDGTLAIESALGKGTSIRVTLPLARSQQSQGQPS